MALGACGGASNGDSVLRTAIATDMESTRSALQVARSAPAIDEGLQSGSPDITGQSVTTTTRDGDPVAGTSTTTTTTVEAVDLAPVLESLDALDGLIGRLDAEIGSIDLEDEGVNP